MNLSPQFAIVAGSRALAIALTVFLFVVGSFPAAGQAFPGVTHWIAHLFAYALIAFTYGLGWREQSTLLLVGFVAALGAFHEYSEIITHGHALEFTDILVNSIGAAIGVGLERNFASKRRGLARPNGSKSYPPCAAINETTNSFKHE